VLADPFSHGDARNNIQFKPSLFIFEMLGVFFLVFIQENCLGFACLDILELISIDGKFLINNQGV
jgi:hypothetical protein